MSRGDVEFLREGYEALARGDMETFTALSRERLAPDFEFRHVWDGRVFKGFEGTMEWIADTRETWEDYSQEVEEIVVLGVVWTFDDGKAIEARSFASREEALEAAGVTGD